MIIALSGKSGSGKTYIANIIKKQLSYSDMNFRIVSFADKLKKHCKFLSMYDIDINGDKSQNTGLGLTYGQLLQKEGKRLKKYDPYIFARYVIDNNPGNIIIDDLRFIEEKAYIESSNRDNIIFRLDYNIEKNDSRDMNDISEVDLDDIYFEHRTAEKDLNKIAKYILNIMLHKNIIKKIKMLGTIVVINNYPEMNQKLIDMGFRSANYEQINNIKNLANMIPLDNYNNIKRLNYVIHNPSDDDLEKLEGIKYITISRSGDSITYNIPRNITDMTAELLEKLKE